MNGLVEKYGDQGFSAVGFPCNQFGHQTNERDTEFLNTLKYVRPGNGFEPKGDIMKKTDVNGFDAHPLFKWMKRMIPIPMDDELSFSRDTKGNGVPDVDALAMGGTFLWTPVTRSDIAWNFEKFLVDKEGHVVKRYSRYYPTADIGKDIENLL